MRIIVSPLTAAALTAAEERPERILSFCDVKGKVPYFKPYPGMKRLVLKMNDLHEERPDGRAPSRADVIKMIEFIAERDLRKTLLIHCVMGISRSMAAAFIALSLHRPGEEAELARRMREKAPHAAPNTRILAFADSVLGRNGAMTHAFAVREKANLKSAGVPVTFDF